MVSTRRQSARLQIAPVAPDSDQDVIEPGSDSDSDLTSLESSDVEYESGHSDGASECGKKTRSQCSCFVLLLFLPFIYLFTAPSGRAPTKRVKTTASKDVVASKDPKPKPKPRKSRKNAATLSLLPSMSIDILFEVTWRCISNSVEYADVACDRYLDMSHRRTSLTYYASIQLSVRL